MKIAVLFTILTGLSALADSSDSSKVNYHLRKLQIVLDANATKARMNSIKVDEAQIETQESLLRNHPGYGIGDENASLGTANENDFATDAPPTLTAEETIRMELEQRRVTNVGSATSKNEAKENEAFIKEFKAKAAAKGVHLEVDPVTLEVRKAR